MATIRKIRLRWQAIVRRKRIHVSKSFWKKGDARRWADKIEAQIEVGSYLEVKKSERLNEIKVYELCLEFKLKKILAELKLKLNYLSI